MEYKHQEGVPILHKKIQRRGNDQNSRLPKLNIPWRKNKELFRIGKTCQGC